MQVTRHSYTMKYLLGLALGKWIVSHHCKSQLSLVITSAKKVSRNVRQVYLVLLEVQPRFPAGKA